MEPRAYRGRFAPSPTGPLHFGSLIAAVGSYLDARAHGGEWLVRIEDIDPPREVAGADVLILDALQACGFEWDGQVTYQSQGHERYDAALDHLSVSGHSYACQCSRRVIRDTCHSLGLPATLYPGTCRHAELPSSSDMTRRVRTTNQTVLFTDLAQGEFEESLSNTCGDFVILRRNGLYAYQLAVVVDDFIQNITHVVRGCDLLDNTPRQIYLQNLLGYTTPTYRHLPTATNKEGQKLSKQTGAKAIDISNPGAELHAALVFLNQNPPHELMSATPEIIWAWAVENWRPGKLQGIKSVKIGSN